MKPTSLCMHLFLGILIVFSFVSPAGNTGNLSSLEEGFITPPQPARPWAYWCWVNGNFSYSQLTHELEEIKRQGMGGFNIFDIGTTKDTGGVPPGPAFMGQESLEGIAYAIREAERLGLEIGLIVSSSWDAGGSWTTPEDGAMGLFTTSIETTGPKTITEKLPFPEVKMRKSREFTDLLGAEGLPMISKNSAVLAVPAGEETAVLPLGKIIDLTDHVDDEGVLKWDVPEGDWTITRYVCTNTGEMLKVPSPNSDGLILDHFKAGATENHFKYIINRLEGALGDIKSSALKYCYLCSYEVRGKVWTPEFQKEFEKRRGYDMTPYLPAIFDRVVENKDVTERFLFDYKKTLSDLIIENHYITARNLLHEYDLEICSEAGGPGPPLHNCPVEALRALGALDIPRGEFWNKHQRLDPDGIDLLWLVKEIACASHIYGKTIVQGESFTSFEQWQEGPFELKPLADRAMCEGLNHFMFHTFAHVPLEAGRPGWMYHAGTHINTTRVWWPKAKAFIDYLARCSYLLQQGLFVGDVCYYYGDQAPNFVKPKDIDPSLGYGYDYDVTNSEVILERMKVKNGRIVLPDGMSYAVLSLPDQETMDMDVLKKIDRLVCAGATVVGPKPTRTHGLHEYEARDREVRELANHLWGDCDGVTSKTQKRGKGQIVWGKSLREVLTEKEIGPDFQVRDKDQQDIIDFIHRKVDKTDLYFVINKSPEWQNVECGFRVTGRIPEFWDSATGEMKKQYLYSVDSENTWIPVRLAPYGSIFVVFKDRDNRRNQVSITRLAFNNPSSLNPVFENAKGDLEVCLDSFGQYRYTLRGQTIEFSIDEIPKPVELTGSWEVRFAHGWGAPTLIEFPELISWTNHELNAIKHFSGIATYKKLFSVPENLLNGDYQLTLDLGRVKEVADIYLNGQALGVLWKEPFAVDISQHVRPGENHLVVEIANVWNNRLVHDGALPPEERRTNTNIHKGPKAWDQPWKDVPLIESGLTGPVIIQFAKKIILSQN